MGIIVNMVLPQFVTVGRLQLEDEFVPTSRVQLLDVTTSTRYHTSATTATGSPSNVATVPPDAALPFLTNCDLGRFVSATMDLPSNKIERKNVYIIFKPGRELGLGECPPMRAFTLPT